MKYYAVTEDPNELFHYGRLGMKWGQHIFGDKPKSPGYKKALGKLRAASKSTKSAIQKSATQHAMNRQKRQQNKYNQAVKNAQRNIELVENLKKLDQVRVNERGLDRDYWGAAKVARIHDRQQRKMDKINNKRAIKQFKEEVKNNRNELKMDKFAEKARQGKLKYSQLSDEQVQRLTSRLTMERNARQLGGAEKTWRQQKKEAFRQGKLQGITRGTAAAMEEVARAGTIYGISKLNNRRKLNAAAKQEGKEDRIRNREKNKKTHRDIVDEIKDEAFETRVREGQSAFKRARALNTGASQAKYLKSVEDAKRIKEEQKRLRESDEQLKNDVYKRIVLGGKGDTTEKIIERLANRGDYYKTIYGKDMPIYDQVSSDRQPHISVSKLSKTAKDVNESLSKVADRLGYGSQTVSILSNTMSNTPRSTSRSRSKRRRNHPEFDLKG